MKKDLSHIRRIDIEFQSYCNRKCPWCPNKEFSRDTNIIMSDETYTNLLHQIKDANFGTIKMAFKGTGGYRVNALGELPVVSFIGYQEPFSNPDLLKKRVNEASDVLGNLVRFTAASNGDLITKESIEKLYLANLLIEDYDNKGKEYWLNRLKELEILVIEVNDEVEVIHGIHRYLGSVAVFLNWTKHIKLENRGGYFQPGDYPQYNWKNDMALRTKPCPEPSYYINISYDGSVMPCCHLRPDNPEHKPYILGNINDTPLVDIFYSEKAEKFRKQMQQENGDYPDPCKRCNKIRIMNLTGEPTGWRYKGIDYFKENEDKYEIETDN